MIYARKFRKEEKRKEINDKIKKMPLIIYKAWPKNLWELDTMYILLNLKKKKEKKSCFFIIII